MLTYADWCRREGVTHAHCPWGCSHPQPFTSDGALYCGRCWFVEGVETVMVPCTPEACPDHRQEVPPC